MVLGDGKSVMSAAMCLAHEMGHAAQHLNGELDAYLSDGEISDDERDVVEAANLAKYENPIAKELGEFTRKDYYDKYSIYFMDNSTDWGVIVTLKWYNYIWPGNWGKPSTYFNNLNKWDRGNIGTTNYGGVGSSSRLVTQ